jgi:hypothetical protein
LNAYAAGGFPDHNREAAGANLDRILIFNGWLDKDGQIAKSV